MYFFFWFAFSFGCGVGWGEWYVGFQCQGAIAEIDWDAIWRDFIPGLLVECKSLYPGCGLHSILPNAFPLGFFCAEEVIQGRQIMHEQHGRNPDWITLAAPIECRSGNKRKDGLLGISF